MPATRSAVLLLGTAGLALCAVPVSGASFTSTSTSAGVMGAAADWNPPTVQVDGVAGTVRGAVTLTATASDAESAVESVRIEVRPAGADAWTALCTATVAPYSCAWSTTAFADGRYEVRAVAADTAGYAGTSEVVHRVVDNTGPVVVIDETSMPDHLRGTVTVPVIATDAGSGVTSVLVQRSTDGRSWTDLCTDVSAPWSCSWTTSGSGEVMLRAIAVDGTGASTTSATALVSVDNVLPSVSAQSPGTTLSGTVTVSATASDADSGVASVTVQQRASSTSPWVTICTDPTSPYSCRWDTTSVPDGTTYSFRAVATDEAGNVQASSATTTSTVDNRVASVSVEDPGAFLRGTVELLANANAPGGVASVAVQYAPSGTSTWTTVCTDTTSPYSCSWDTTRVPGGRYDLRAVMTPVSGSVLVSALVTGRTVDNAPLRAADVQAGNGGQLGRADAGDTVSFTYSREVDLGSLASGWTGTPRAVTVRLRDGGANLGAEDVLEVFTSSALTTPVALGQVNLRGNYVKGQALLFSATLTAETVQVAGLNATRVVVRLDALASNDTSRVVKTARTMTWTPSTAARDLSGGASAASPVDEQGGLDRDL